MTACPLLQPNEPNPVAIVRPMGRSPFLLTCDHAGRRVPETLGRLGLPEPEFDRHIAYDIGAAAVSRRMANALDAVLIEQRYSRLVIDCNRPPGVESSIPTVSESTQIPGNADLSDAERRRREAEIFEPYQQAIAREIERRASADIATVLVAMHSFTPVYKGEARPWHIGTLYGRDARLAVPLRDELAAEGRYVVGDNQPYSVSAGTDATIPMHGEARGLLHVGIEIRQDLITDETGQAAWATTLIRLLPRALATAERLGRP